MKNVLKGVCLALTLLGLTVSCQKEEKKRERSIDFESLMGKDLPAWKYVQTQEDKENILFFKQLYQRNEPLLRSPGEQVKIPKVMHFIWIGPKPFPRTSVENVRGWMGKNPDWQVKFWTDRDRPLPHPKMILCKVQDLHFQKLEECYNKSDNYGEKSDILRYEILFQEGGVYVDHDVKCLSSFDSLNKAYDLYCGLEVPYPTSLSSSVLPTNNIVASRAGHPVLQACLEWLPAHWDQIQRDYPGADRDSVINRVSHRTFYVLGAMMKNLANKDGNHDIAFPAYYFNAPKDDMAIFARHLYEGSWFENESAFEKATRERLMYISKKSNKIVLFSTIVAALNILGFGTLFYLHFRNRKRMYG